MANSHTWYIFADVLLVAGSKSPSLAGVVHLYGKMEKVSLLSHSLVPACLSKPLS